MSFFSSIVAKLVESLVAKFLAFAKKWFNFRREIAKDNEKIDAEAKAVVTAVNEIKRKNANGEPLTDDDVRKLRDASRDLSRNFYR